MKQPNQGYDRAGHPGDGGAGEDCLGLRPKLTARQQAELTRMHATGEYTIADLMEVFSVGRAAVYRAQNRAATSTLSPAAGSTSARSSSS